MCQIKYVDHQQRLGLTVRPLVLLTSGVPVETVGLWLVRFLQLKSDFILKVLIMPHQIYYQHKNQTALISYTWRHQLFVSCGCENLNKHFLFRNLLEYLYNFENNPYFSAYKAFFKQPSSLSTIKTSCFSSSTVKSANALKLLSSAATIMDIHFLWHHTEPRIEKLCETVLR